MSFVDILRPFGEQNDLNAPLRMSEQNMRNTETRLRFGYAHTIDQPTAEVIDAHLNDVMQHVSDENEKEMPHVLNPAKRLDPAPWFLKYRQDFLRLL